MISKDRKIAEAIQALTGESLVIINRQAMEYVEMGIMVDRISALKYILSMLVEELESA